MIASETKKIAISLLIMALAIFLAPSLSNFNIASATSYSSSNYTVLDPVVDSGLQSSFSSNFGLGQSLSQIAIGKSTSASFQLWSGFQYFYTVKANSLSATPGDQEVDLNWTVPAAALGISPATYQVGTGTSSGSYVFENVGAVTSWTKTGLTNGVPYYFIIKSFSAGGTFLVYSNEATATPTGVTPTPTPTSGGGGGGGGGSYTGAINISGTAYPGSNVTILRDSNIVSIVTADSLGNFSASINGMSSGTYSFSLYATDSAGNHSPSLGFERTISNTITTTVNNLILAPTIQLNYSEVKQGDPLTISGWTAPNAPVTLSFGGQQTWIANTTSNSNGYYAYVLDSGTRPKGQYTVYARATVSGSSTPNSFSVPFRIGDNTVEPPPPATCGKRSDLNCDGKVNLIDFSILLYFWDLNDFSRNPRADIDQNGDVGLRDLSIMLYDWTG